MRNILFTYPTQFHPEYGGIERITDLLAKAFINKGYNVYYLHAKKNCKLDNYDYPAEMFFFPDGQKLSNENKQYLTSLCLDKKIDIIINQAGAFGDSRLFLSCKEKLNIKTISVIHSKPSLNYKRLYTELFKLRDNTLKEKIKLLLRIIFYFPIRYRYKKQLYNHYQWLFNHTDKICLLSDKYKNDFIDLGLNITNEKFCSIHNANTFNKTDIKFNKKEKIILYVGRLTYGEKRPDRILKIWNDIYKKFPDWKLIIIGDGKDRYRLESIARKMERVIFLGTINPKEYYYKASILSMTSNFEGWPMVLPEALSMGCVPILYGSFEAAYDIIHNNEDGYIIPPFKKKTYTQYLKKLMSDDVIRNSMALKEIKSIDRFNIEHTVEKWINLFDSL